MFDRSQLMTTEEVMEYLNVSRRRVFALAKDGMIERAHRGLFDAQSVAAYKAKRGDKKAGRYPKS